MIRLGPWTGKYMSKKRFKKQTLMPSTVLKKVLVAQTTAEDYEVYKPFFLFFYNREIHRIGNMGNKSTAALAISPEKGGFAGRTQD